MLLLLERIEEESSLSDILGGAKEGREGLGPNVSKKDLRQHIFLLLLKKKEEERKKKKKQLQL